MIPLHLKISGFLSYRDPVELGFNSFDLACISGHNGAGKSSLLDSITWVLFGEARGKGADVINLNQDVKAAEVALTFLYEGNTYRVQRTLPRGKSTVLEFQVKDGDRWRPLTEKTTRETQARIEQTLRLDHETFINASFFLQGKADQFTQKKAGERKAVLSSILGLEVWDVYKERAAEKRKNLEHEVNTIDGRVAEIDAELGEEDSRRQRLNQLREALNQLSAAREAQEGVLENLRRNAALIAEQRKMVETLSASLEKSRAAESALEKRLNEKEKELASYADLMQRAKEIEAEYKAWQKLRKELEAFEENASAFREHEKERAPLLEVIAAEKARLEEERRSLRADEEAMRGQKESAGELKAGIEKAKKLLADVEKKIEERRSLEAQRNELREKIAAMSVENVSLNKEMKEIKERRDNLAKTSSPTCPFCGQPLSKQHIDETVKQLNQEGTIRGDLFRANKSKIEDCEKEAQAIEKNIAKLANADNERLEISNSISQMSERLERLESLAKDWETSGKKRLAEIDSELEKESFAKEARKQLAKLDKELAKLGYDAAAHDIKRKEEIEARHIEEDYRKLDTAKELSKQIQSEIKSLKEDRKKRSEEIAEQTKSYEQAAKALSESETNSPNLQEAEQKLISLREEENETRGALGGAEQKVKALDTLRARKADYTNQREELNLTIARYKSLERAFGKDGVPALLIEQALPQIEQKTNDLLERLSDGKMSIRFVTQAEYKDKKRDDLKETLDIQISDSAGTRDYEMYSGGEAFRVNFAIRLALSEILAQRKGARLQTLVIDEGFGSQDALGRQRLVEAINLIKDDFAKILIITHLDELKDAFPNRIEVEKSERGSVVRVI